LNVLIIPEDQLLDQYILKPVIEGVFADLGRRARVMVLPEPRLRGSGDALDPDLVAKIIEDNHPMIEVFILIVDKDCDRDGHVGKVKALELAHPSVLVGCLAVEEVETWMLALHRAEVENQFRVKWSEVRQHCDPKETFAEPFLEALESVGPGKGRKAAMREIKSQWKTLTSLCSEIQDLQNRLSARFQTT